MERELAQRDFASNLAVSLHDYVAPAFSVIEPGAPYLSNWHIELICEKLEKVSSGEITRLIINVPPGTMKTLLGGVMWPSWDWLRNPWIRMQYLSHAHSVVKKSSRDMRDLIRSDWYYGLRRSLASDGKIDYWRIAKDQDEKLFYATTSRGFRQSFTFGGTITGDRGHRQLIDDPHDMASVTHGPPELHEKHMNEARHHDDKVLSNRVNIPGAIAPRVLWMQRVHPLDLTASWLASEDDVVHVCLPMHYDPEHPFKCPDDPRTQPGELLWPDMWDEKKVIREERKQGDLAPAVLEQKPERRGGKVYHKEYFEQFYDTDPQVLRVDDQIISVDPNVKETKAGSYFCAQVWGRKWGGSTGVMYFLLDEYRVRCDHFEAKGGLIALAKRWPHAYTMLVEDKANGEAVYSDLRRSLRGLTRFKRGTKDKITHNQVNGVPPCAAMEVWLPRPDHCPWIMAWRDEVCNFPGHPNDRADVMAQAFAYWRAMDDGGDAQRTAEEQLAALNTFL
jgi:phage terminase large subunit-like protein